LKLDHNAFGSEGVIALAEGLAVNPVLRMLSLTYCGIDAIGADALFEIMIYTRSALEEVNLSGNVLMNEGICTLLRGVSIAKSLKKLLIADNQFNDDTEVLKALHYCMKRNEKLGKYDLKYNIISDAGK
jgi:Ran GTPase-activating protein (RanGAP) involved in mRNA processing and transport